MFKEKTAYDFEEKVRKRDPIA